MIWLAVLVALLAAAGNNIGKVLQKKGTRGLPLLKLDVKVRCPSIGCLDLLSLMCYTVLLETDSASPECSEVTVGMQLLYILLH